MAQRDRSSGPRRRISSGQRRRAAPEPSGPPPAETFRLGAVPGATPGKWISIWRERMPRTTLELVEIAASRQRDDLIEGRIDAALVRLPITPTDLHVIPLYEEVPVVVMSADSSLTVAEELAPEDLAGEVLITPADDVLGALVDGPVVEGTLASSFAPPVDTKAAIELAATGIGVVLLPMSLARLHHRRDVTFRPLPTGPVSRIGLAWVAERTTPEVEAFVGIVRGRSARSSRA